MSERNGLIEAILTFESVHFVLKAEKILKEAGVGVKLIPTPRALSAECGVCIVVSSGDVEVGGDRLRRSNISFRLFPGAGDAGASL